MPAAALPINDGLFGSSRVPSLARPGQNVSLREAAVLLLVGAGAAVLSASLDLHLRIPGHAIIRSVFPMAFGLALVPRRCAGVCMGAGAWAASFLLRAGGWGIGPGALTSLCLTGPCLDLALLGARGGWRLYPRFVLAGLASNLLALVMRFGFRAFEWHADHSMAAWFGQAVLTYPLCGVVAGLVSAAVWFSLREPKLPDDAAPSP
jgi:hypothetical protein